MSGAGRGLRYLKAYWGGPDPGPAAEWGGSWWFFEIDPDGWVERQVVQFDNGKLLLYDRDHLDDQWGGLAHTAIDPDNPREGPYESIRPAEFEAAWLLDRAHNH